MSGIIDPKNMVDVARAFRGTDLEHIGNRPGKLGPGTGPNVNPLDQFANMLQNKVTSVNNTMLESEQKIDAYVRGEEQSVHDIMIAMTKADINFKLMAQVGRKVIEAYQEIMRMQV